MSPLQRLEHYFPVWQWLDHPQDDVWVAAHEVLWLVFRWTGTVWQASLHWSCWRGALLMSWDGYDSQESLVRLVADIRGMLREFGQTFTESTALRVERLECAV